MDFNFYENLKYCNTQKMEHYLKIIHMNPFLVQLLLNISIYNVEI